VPELVGRESEHRQLARELLAQFIHLREVPGGRASQGGGVLHQHHLPLVVGHAHHPPVQQLGPHLVEGRHPPHSVLADCLKIT